MNKFALIFIYQWIISVNISAQDTLGLHLATRDSTVPVINLSVNPVTKDSRKVQLEWISTGVSKDIFHIIERSDDEKNFEVIGAMKAALPARLFVFSDDRPNTVNYYRIKIELPGGKIVYSSTISAGLNGVINCKFYPNPVDKLLIVKTDKPVELQISDSQGKKRITQHLQPGLQLVNVSLLEKGIYIILLKEKDSDKVITDKLIKN